MSTPLNRRRRMMIATICVCVFVATFNVYFIDADDTNTDTLIDLAPKRDTLIKSLNTLQASYNKALESQAVVRDSLPYCINAGPGSQMRYQAYLYDLAIASGLQDIVVQQGSPFSSDTKTQWIQCSTRAAGSISSVMQFMKTIESQSPAHRITSARVSADNDQIRSYITTSICATVLRESSHSLTASDATVAGSQYNSAAIRSLFGFRPSVAPEPQVVPKVPVAAPTKIKLPVSQQLILIGTIKTPHSRKAVLLDTKASNHRTLARGDTVDCGDGTHATVLSVGLDAILLRRLSATRILHIGDALESVVSR